MSMSLTSVGAGSQAPYVGVAAEGGSAGFSVRLDNFEGPFDLLLQLIARRELDITEVALSTVTDEFIASARALSPSWDLESTSSFLAVAATLLELKVARLLPTARVEDEEDMALLETRDLLFARLLQYRAFKQVAGVLDERMSGERRRFPRQIGPDERFSALLPDVELPLAPEGFAALAASALHPKPVPTVALDHLHAPTVSVRDQAASIIDRLRRSRVLTFRSLGADSSGPLTTVARFLALLELFREGNVAFDQLAPMGELSVRWTGTDDGEIDVLDEYDEAVPAEPEPAAAVTDLDVLQLAAGGEG